MRSSTKIFSALAGAALLVASLASFAQQDGPIPEVHRLQLFTSTVAASATTNRTGNVPINIPPSRTFTIQATVLGAGVDRNTGAVTFGFNISLDGSSWTTNFPYAGEILADGTNAVVRMVAVGTNMPARFASLGRIVNAHTNAITITNAFYSFLP